MLFSACSDSKIKTGGEYTAYLSENPSNLDPQMASDKASFNVIRNIYATLVDVDNSGMIACGAAESYTVSDDGLVYTFILRDGLVWKGIASKETVPLSADDYVFAFKRINDDVTGSPHKKMYEEIDSIYAKDSRTLCIELKEPNCDFLKKLAYPAASPCCEKLFLSTDGRYGLSAEDTYSCGAFYVSDWNYDPYWTENHVTLTRINKNSLDGYITYPDEINFLIKSDVVTDVYTVNEKTEPEKGHILSEPYFCKMTVLLCSKDMSDDERNTLMSLAYAELPCENEDHIKAFGLVPPAVTVMNQSLRNMFSDRAEGAENKHYRFDDKKYHTILISSEYTAYDTIYALTDVLRTADYYSEPYYCSYDEFMKKYEEGDHELCVYTVRPSLNSAEEMFKSLYDAAKIRNDKLFYMSSIGDPSTKAHYAHDLENSLINSGEIVPVTYDSVYVSVRKDISDYWYEPFTDTLFFKYMKGDNVK